MKILPAAQPGIFVLESEPATDERGFFARIFDSALLAKAGLRSDFPQWSISYNRLRGTLRGLHWQASPFEETKLVRCTQGAIFDVVADVRRHSPTRGAWFGIELSASNRRSLYIPAGFAHGFQTLTDETEVLYHISEHYRADLARGVRWDDPTLSIDWPIQESIVISERDASLPTFEDIAA